MKQVVTFVTEQHEGWWICSIPQLDCLATRSRSKTIAQSAAVIEAMNRLGKPKITPAGTIMSGEHLTWAWEGEPATMSAEEMADAMCQILGGKTDFQVGIPKNKIDCTSIN